MSSQQFKTDLRSALLSNAPLFALLGNNLFSGLAPQQQGFPYMTYAVVSAVDSYSHEGIVNTPFARLQFDVFAETVDEVGMITDVFKDAINDTVMGRDHGTTRFAGCFLSGDAELFDPAIGSYRRSVDFRFNYNRVV